MRKFLKLAITVCFSLAAASGHADYKPTFTVVEQIARLHVNKDGTSVEEFEATHRINTAQAIRTLGEQKISFVSTLKTLEITEAYTIRPDGSKIHVDKDKIRTQDEASDDGSAVYSDTKVTTIIFPNVEVGSQVHYKAKKVQHTPLFPGHFIWSYYFSPHSPYENTKVFLTYDPAIDLQFSHLGLQSQSAAQLANDDQGNKRYVFEFKQPDAYPSEPARLALMDFAPHILITSFKDYPAFALAYQARAYDKTAPTPDIERLAREIVGSDTQPLKQARKLYNWVTHNIRYVAVYVGAGGYVPHDAQSILDNRYGDCKDHVVILEALLRVMGIDSSPALVNSGDAFALPKLPVASPFNHVITYLPKYNLYLDSTDEFAPFGILGDDEMDKPVLLTATGELKRTPKTDPSKDFVEVKTQLRLLKDGRIKGTSVSKMHGFFEADSRRAQFGYENRDQESIVNDLLERFQERGVGRFKAGNPKELDVPWSVDSTFELNAMINMPGPSAMTIPIGISPGYLKSISGATAPKARRYPVGCRSLKYHEMTELVIPPELKIQHLPQSMRLSVGPMRYKANYTMRSGKLLVDREYVSIRDTSVCGAQDDQRWTKLSEALQRDMRNQIFFK